MFVSPDASVVRRALVVLLVLGTAVFTVKLASNLRSTGDEATKQTLELGTGAEPRHAFGIGNVLTNANGYVVDAKAASKSRPPWAAASVPIRFGHLKQGQHAIVHVWAYGPPGVQTRVYVVRSDFSRRLLGRPAPGWTGKPFDVTAAAHAGKVSVEAETTNHTGTQTLFLDRITTGVVPRQYVASVNPLVLGAWVTLFVLAVLACVRRLGRYWPAALAGGVGAAILWHEAYAHRLSALAPDDRQAWVQVRSGRIFDLHTGLFSGHFGTGSDLGGQLFGLLRSLGVTGDGEVGARMAGVLVGVLVVLAAYALGQRVAGILGALGAVSVALLSDSFRGLATSGSTDIA